MAAIEPLLEDFPQAFRALVVKKHYKVIYYIEKDTIYAVTIWDCRQNPNKLKLEIDKI